MSVLTAVVIMLGANPVPTKDALEAETQAWHERRLRSLTSDDGWLTLVGLHWLEEGESAAGSAEGLAVQLAAGAPAKLGTFTRRGAEVSFSPSPEAKVTLRGEPFRGGALKTDAGGAPDVLEVGTLRMHVIVRGARVGLRVKDREAPARKAFHGIERYPVSGEWRVTARFEPAKAERKIAVPTVLGTVEEMVSPGTAVFQLKGKEYRLTPVLEDGQLFFIFADQTNKTETYGAGRFLYAALPKDGAVVLDFNRAYNPPCAFSPFATCPLPPKENRLAVRIEAGEKRAGDH
jgi:hypothetical protein